MTDTPDTPDVSTANPTSSPKPFGARRSTQILWFVLWIVFTSALTVLSYWPALHGGYVWDDDIYLTDNASIKASDGLATIWRDPLSVLSGRHPATQNPYPLVFTTFWIEYRMWGLNPAGYHAVNVALHVLNSILLVILLWRLGVAGAVIAGTIFALHPVHVESVAWITERKDVLSGFFYLASFLSWLRFMNKKSWAAYTLSLVLFIAALFSKTVTCTLPAAALLIALWRTPRQFKRAALASIPFFLLAIIFAWMTARWEKLYTGGSEEMVHLTAQQRWIIAGRTPWFYLSKGLWPANLMAIYPKWELSPKWEFSATRLDGALFIALGIAILFFAILYVRRRSSISIAAAFFILTLAPALGFINYSTMLYSYVADHYQYLASIAWTAVGAAVFSRAFCQSSSRMRLALHLGFTLAVATMCFLSSKAAATYSDYETLFRDNFRKNPKAWAASYNVGWALEKKGKREEAISFFEKTLELRPGDMKSLNKIALAKFQSGKTDEAIEVLNRAYKLDPNDLQTLETFGRIELARNHYDQAARFFLQELTLNPNVPTPLAYLGMTRLQQGMHAEAEVYFRKSLEAIPNQSEVHDQLALALFSEKKEEAVEHFKTAIELDPANIEACDNLGLYYMQQGKFREAVPYFEMALKTNPQDPKAISNLQKALGGKQ